MEPFYRMDNTNCWSTKSRIKPVLKILPCPIFSYPIRQNRSNLSPFKPLRRLAHRLRPAPLSSETAVKVLRWHFTCAPPNLLKMVNLFESFYQLITSTDEKKLTVFIAQPICCRCSSGNLIRNESQIHSIWSCV